MINAHGLSLCVMSLALALSYAAVLATIRPTEYLQPWKECQGRLGIQMHTYLDPPASDTVEQLLPVPEKLPLCFLFTAG
jgi:hypothetical protein